MSRVGFLGCGKIGKAMLNDLKEEGKHEISFVQDPFYSGDYADFPVVSSQDEALLENTDLVIECATADVLKENIDGILKYSDLLLFSVTCFADEDFYEHTKDLMNTYGRKVYLPHGAILGVDGIADGRKVINSVTIETTKNPKSLSRDDKERTVVYEGSAREACKAYPRNVNVHATVSLAGLGFDRTLSRIVSDPAVTTNTHKIIVDGDGIHFEIVVSSEAAGAVTGKYTPYSAVASMHKILDDDSGFHFV